MMCPKCGATMRGPFWHERREFPSSPACEWRDVNPKLAEHLHYYCACGFDQTGPTHSKRRLS